MTPSEDEWVLIAIEELAWSVLHTCTTFPEGWWGSSFPSRLIADARSVARRAVEADRVRADLEAWHRAGGPYQWIRSRHPAREPPIRLADAEIERVLRALTLNGGVRRVDVFRIFVEAGYEPDVVEQLLSKWKPGDGLLPTGQAIPDELEARVRPSGGDDGVVLLPDGNRLAPGLARRALGEARAGSKISAIKEVRRETGWSLKESKGAVDALLAGEVRLGPGIQLPTMEKQGSRDPATRKLEDCIDGLLLDRPFYWVTLASALIRPDPRIPTMAVGVTEAGQIALFYNPKFVLRTGRERLMGVLVHEINHVIFGHVVRPRPSSPHGRWAELVASEVTANEFVPYPLPGEPITLERVDLPPGESTDFRVDRLLKRKERDPKVDDHMIRALLTADPKHARDVQKEPPTYPTDVLMEAAELVAGEADRDVAQTIGREAGRIAGRIAELLTPEIGVETLPWDQLLREMTRRLKERRSTRRYPSRRAPDRVGIVPGRRNRQSRPTVMVAVDTSASMGTSELQQVSGELQSLTRQSVRVAVVQCDTEIQDARWVAEGSGLTELLGRGGTDLRPPFGPEIRHRFDPELIVYFTDGYGPAPEAAPAGVKVLWVLTGTSPRAPAEYGRVVCMRPRAQRSAVRR